ncbi:adenylate/guanylate cyclase domain-containing protein [soil metagenome]
MWPISAARIWTRTPANPHIDRLLTEAEISAERIVAFVRCGVGIAASLLFFTVVVPTLAPDNPVSRQIPVIATFSVGYFAVGVASLLLARPRRFRGWMIWLFTTLDLCFWFGLTASTVVNLGVFANYLVASPPTIVTFMILALVSLRNNPWLQAYTLVFMVSALMTLFMLAPDPRSEGALVVATIDPLFQLPQSIMRLSMLVVTGLTLILATFRTRQLLNRAIVETVQRINLTRYLPTQLAGRMARIDDDRLRSGTVQEAAVMFVDIRGFTTLAEGMDPHSLSEFLAEFRGIVSGQVHAHNGIVDKFVGDSVMAVFGALEPGRDDAANAVACTVGIVGAIEQWNAARRQHGLELVVAGVGAHWGEVFYGAVGDSARLEFTVLGDTVNVAARLEKATKEAGFPIVVSHALLAQAGVRDSAATGWLLLEELQIRGRSGRLQAYARS